ncbi:hypothetical protein [Nostoc sp. MS1]|uniref:hypothetical protein n=1 Tax=Nostoc sp. MS1 TaxID=2764711 RepID=UPI001CC6C469|nr:hypothetical protein [Nostoc sp. MS1]BCL39728.1 hypothetical protein NSMS1_61750 [Nostoc sp. MS1]
MNIDQFQELKQKLTLEADLSVIWSFYMDYFADDPEFIELGEPKYNEYLDAVIHKTGEQIFGRVIKITGFLPIYIAEYGFFHAPFWAEQRIGGVIYFEDIKVGLIAVSADYPPTDEVKYSRFSEVMQLPTPNRNELN